MWTFYDFLDVRGINLVRLWLDGLPKKVQAKIDVRILFMQAQLIWPDGWVSALNGWPDILEVRIGSFGAAYRPLGFYGPGQKEFTIVLGTVEKGKLPKRVLEAADERRRIVI
jgi:Gp49-like protein DUF891